MKQSDNLPLAWVGLLFRSLAALGLAVLGGAVVLCFAFGIRDASPLLLLGPVLALIGLIGWLCWLPFHWHGLVLQKLSRRYNLAYSPQGRVEELDAFAALPLFWRGKPVAPRHRLDGTLDGKAVVILDHAYATGKVEFMEGSFEAGARQTVVIFRNTGLPDFQAVPKLGILEQPVGDELMDDFEACGFAEVSLENPELARRYRVGSANPAVARVMHGPFGDALAATKGWTVESAGGLLAFYRRGHTWGTFNYKRRLDAVMLLARSLNRPATRRETGP